MNNYQSATTSEVSDLMLAVFGNEIFSRDYIEWLYRRSPDGDEIATNERDNGQLIGHYAIVPHPYLADGQPLRFGLSLNTAVAEVARGRGLFTALALKTYQRAESEGVDAVIGVANANSTPGFLKKLGFRLLGSLPVTIGIAVPWHGSTRSAPVTSEFLASELEPATRGVDWNANRHGCKPVWSYERLRWRLAQPNARYQFHSNDDAVAVSTVQRQFGVDVAIVLKAWPRSGRRLKRSLLRAICGVHGTPIYLHAGTSRPTWWLGAPLPKKLRPAPLNLIYRPITARAPKAETIAIENFDFLDFDAY